MVSDVGDVVLDDAGERSGVGNAGHSGRKLAMPQQSVATEQFTVLCCVAGSLLGAGVRKLVLRRLAGVPFHAVLWCNLAKVSMKDALGLTAAEGAGVGDVAKVHLVLCCEGFVDAVRATSGSTSFTRARSAA